MVKSKANNERTVISVHLDTKSDLDQIGNKGDTYDSIIKRLIKKIGDDKYEYDIKRNNRTVGN